LQIEIRRRLQESAFFCQGYELNAYSAELFADTRQRLFGLSQPRQYREVVLLMLITG
jgi:hypothetical protein